MKYQLMLSELARDLRYQLELREEAVNQTGSGMGLAHRDVSRRIANIGMAIERIAAVALELNEP